MSSSLRMGEGRSSGQAEQSFSWTGSSELDSFGPRGTWCREDFPERWGAPVAATAGHRSVGHDVGSAADSHWPLPRASFSGKYLQVG